MLKSLLHNSINKIKSKNPVINRQAPHQFMAPSTALKRLMNEYKELTLNAPEGITAGPISEANYFEWEAFIQGPEDTPYEGAVFSAIIKFPRDYPLMPPTMTFTCPMYHPNIYPDGKVCISILHAPGPLG